ncbi:hypothetical protein [Mycobacterium marinum]|uniref:hypothetical protein n=1 Tax=Mycobacterium marinum TaxID=1781 RepID=UPI000358CF69|nr:hypothetical protein [Mycobacterium marinum]AXN47531.1 hypothetical protein CCUG20998_00107 [Mycobacterium marinum]EPQ72374.1 hypothetical protein MMEU_3756 [Mycobacterium marinum str. Europe]RFZ15565.1 hypothetical protein DSM43519_05376 [Mycobacterium marinum]RFZ17072.1 hypothetical protein DSM44344_05464 [Mycobacterium marinum]RFZ64103.1 hypothetical protein DE4576_04390 [Mycobacterium marinum]
MPATLSQIRAWSTEHLIDAAGYWTKTADQWENAFFQMRNQSYALGWSGAGGDALRERTSADLPIVGAKADMLRQAAGIARNGASDISAAQRRVLYAVEDAHNAGFTVGEGLSVTDTRASATAAEQAARQAQAQAFAGDIRLRAEQLDGAEVKVAGQLAATTAGLSSVTFAQNGGGVQLVDFTRDDATDPPPFAPWDTPDGTHGAPPGAGLSPKLQQMLLGDDQANLTGQGLVDNLQRLVQSLPENDPKTAWLRGQVADLQAHVNDIDYARTHCSTSDWIGRTTQFATGVITTGIGGLTAETGAGVAVAVAGGLNTLVAGGGLLQCLTGSK